MVYPPSCTLHPAPCRRRHHCCRRGIGHVRHLITLIVAPLSSTLLVVVVRVVGDGVVVAVAVFAMVVVGVMKVVAVIVDALVAVVAVIVVLVVSTCSKCRSGGGGGRV